VVACGGFRGGGLSAARTNVAAMSKWMVWAAVLAVVLLTGFTDNMFGGNLSYWISTHVRNILDFILPW
jgi:hypothetical protein